MKDLPIGWLSVATRVWLFGLLVIKTNGQLVLESLTLVSSATNVQTVNSTAQMSIVLRKTAFIGYWRYNKNDIVFCEYPGTGPSVNIDVYNTSVISKSRVNASYFLSDNITLELTIRPVQIDDNNVPIDLTNAVVGGGILGSTHFQVTEGCGLVDSDLVAQPIPGTCELEAQCQLSCNDENVGSAEGTCHGDGMVYTTTNTCQDECFLVNAQENVNTEIPVGCNRSAVCKFSCVPGMDGNATGVCQSDGSINVSSDCTNVKCEASSFEVPDTCSNSIVSPTVSLGYNDELQTTCDNGFIISRCVKMNEFENVSSFLVLDFNAKMLESQNIYLVADQSENLDVKATGYNFNVTWKVDGEVMATLTSSCDYTESGSSNLISVSYECEENSSYNFFITLSNVQTAYNGTVISVDVNDMEPFGPWTLIIENNSSGPPKSPVITLVVLVFITRWLTD